MNHPYANRFMERVIIIVGTYIVNVHFHNSDTLVRLPQERTEKFCMQWSILVRHSTLRERYIF